jgi:hypothetical protein
VVAARGCQPGRPDRALARPLLMTLPFLAFATGQFAFHSLPQECCDRLPFIQYGIDPVPRPFREPRRDLLAWFVDSLPAHAGDN